MKLIEEKEIFKSGFSSNALIHKTLPYVTSRDAIRGYPLSVHPSFIFKNQSVIR